MRKIEYQVVYDEGEDVATNLTLAEARKAYREYPGCAELHKVVWTTVRDFNGRWIPLSEEAEREDIILEVKNG